MEIKSFPLEPVETPTPTPGVSRAEGVVNLPQGAKIIHVGATPPHGEMYVFAEVSPMKLPTEPMDVMVLQEDDVVPSGYEYLSYILAIPILFIYRRKTGSIIAA